MIKSKKLIVSSIAIAGATLIASQQNSILNNSILGNFTNPVIGFAATNPEWAPHPEHGKVVALDDVFEDEGVLGTLYEDGTYIMRPISNNARITLHNANGGVETMFYGEYSILSKIKTFKVEGNIVADMLEFAGTSVIPSTIDLTGLTLSEKAEMPFLTYHDDVLRSITFDPNFSLSNVRLLDRMFDGTPNLKLSNEQVSQLLKNVRFESYYGRMFSEVGVERLDLSTFDNSRLKITESVANNGYDHEGHVFKNLIGLNEIVFGDSFSFENYNPKGTKWSFFDTNLSGVKKVTLSGVGTGNHKFVKDWLTDVKKAQLENSDGLYRNGQFVMSVEDALKSRDDKIWEGGIYTLGPVLNLNKKEPTVEHKAIPSPVIYEKDETRDYGEPNQTVNGEPGDEVTTTTYSVDTQTGKITPTVGKPVRTKEPTPTKVKVAAKDKVETYKDEEGRTVNKVTEYNVDETTGVVTPSTTITYGDKKDSTEEHKSIPSPVVYEKDETRDYGEPNQTVNGEPGDEVTITTYSVDPQTGKVTSKTADPVIKKEPTSTKVKVAGKTKVVETEIPYKTTYVEDEGADFGTPNKIQEGVSGKEKTTTTYFVDPKTGEVTSKEEKTKVSDPQNKTVKVGTKPKIEQITENGNLYEVKTIYKLNKETGEVTPETTKKFIKKVQSETKEPNVKTPTVKTALNTGVDSAANILPILSLIGLTGGIVLPNRLKKKD